MIEYSGFNKLDKRIYVSEKMPPALLKPIIAITDAAKLNVKKFWGDMLSHPVLIFCRSEEEYNTYGNATGTPAMIHLTPFGSYIIISPDGANVDVLSHEICHAELLKRAGWFIKSAQIPAWFDEGLALRLDERYPNFKGNSYLNYRMQWIESTSHGNKSMKLTELEKIDDFYNKDGYWTYIAYLTSGMEVARWMELVKKEGLLELIKELKNGKKFMDAYKEIEEKTQKHLIISQFEN